MITNTFASETKEMPIQFQFPSKTFSNIQPTPFQLQFPDKFLKIFDGVLAGLSVQKSHVRPQMMK